MKATIILRNVSRHVIDITKVNVIMTESEYQAALDNFYAAKKNVSSRKKIRAIKMGDNIFLNHCVFGLYREDK